MHLAWCVCAWLRVCVTTYSFSLTFRRVAKSEHLLTIGLPVRVQRGQNNLGLTVTIPYLTMNCFSRVKLILALFLFLALVCEIT